MSGRPEGAASQRQLEAHQLPCVKSRARASRPIAAISDSSDSAARRQLRRPRQRRALSPSSHRRQWPPAKAAAAVCGSPSADIGRNLIQRPTARRRRRRPRLSARAAPPARPSRSLRGSFPPAASGRRSPPGRARPARRSPPARRCAPRCPAHRPRPRKQRRPSSRVRPRICRLPRAVTSMTPLPCRGAASQSPIKRLGRKPSGNRVEPHQQPVAGLHRRRQGRAGAAPRKPPARPLCRSAIMPPPPCASRLGDQRREIVVDGIAQRMPQAAPPRRGEALGDERRRPGFSRSMKARTVSSPT